MSDAELKFGPEWIRALSQGPNLSSPPTSPGVAFAPKYKLAEFRYGREEMLALFSRNSKPPEELQESPTLLKEKPQLPLALQPLEEEQQPWPRSYNSETVYRGRGRPGGGPLGLMSSGGVRGHGGSVDRGRGRGGRGGYYPRGVSFDDEGDPHREGGYRGGRSYERSQSMHERPGWGERTAPEDRNGAVSPRKEFSRSSTENWRYRDNEKEDKDGWRVMGREKWGRNNWRGDLDRGYEDRDPRHGRIRSVSGRWEDDGRSRRWEERRRASDEAEMPAWAMENPHEAGGSFDASGAFMEPGFSDEEEGKSKSPKEPKLCDQEIMSHRDEERSEVSESGPSSVQNDPSVSKMSESRSPEPISENVLSEEPFYSDEESEFPRPPSHPSTQDTSHENQNISVITSKPNLNNLPGPGSSPEGQRPEGGSVDKLIVEATRPLPEKLPASVAQSPPKSVSMPHAMVRDIVMGPGPAPVVYGNRREEVQMDEVADDLVNKLVDDDEDKKVTVDDAKMDRWYYMDPLGKMQGPFPSQEMNEWYIAGYFKSNLMLKRECDDRFSKLGDLKTSLWGNRVPFLCPKDVPPIKVSQPKVEESYLLAQQEYVAQQQLLAQAAQHQMLLNRQLLMRQAAVNLTKMEGWNNLNPLQQEQFLRQQMLAANMLPISVPTSTDITAVLQAKAQLAEQVKLQEMLKQQQQQRDALQNVLTQVKPSEKPITSQPMSVEALINQQQPMKPNIEPVPFLPTVPTSVPPADPIQSLLQQLQLNGPVTSQAPPQPPSDSIWGDAKSAWEIEKEEMKRNEEKLKMEELQKQAEARLAEEEERRRAEEERRKAEEERRKLEEERKKLEEERKSVEAERLRQKQEDEERQRQEEERRKAEEERLWQEEMKRQQLLAEEREREAERKRQEEQKKKEEERQRKKQEEKERKKKEEEERQRQLQIKKKQDEEKRELERRKQEEEEKRQAEQQLLQQEALRRLQEQQQAAQAQQLRAKTVSAPWAQKMSSSVTPVDAPSLTQIQKLQEEREKIERIQREKQHALQLQREAELALQRQQQQQQQRSFRWADGPSAVPPVKSLTEIQAEEAAALAKKKKEKERQEKKKQKNQIAHQECGSPQNLTWAALASGKKGQDSIPSWPVQTAPQVVPGAGFWDDPIPPVKQQQQAPKAGHSQKESGKGSQPPKETGKSGQSSKSNKSRQKKEEEHVKRLFDQTLKDRQNDNFTQWCMKALSGMNTAVDIATFVGFLKDVESPYEVDDYVKSYLGEGKDAKDFTRQFLERRSKLQKGSGSKQMPATNSSVPTEFIEVKSKKGKGKKGKVQKVDARLLGFNVTAPSDRINVGERDYVEGM